jgi:hypothetical protein
MSAVLRLGHANGNVTTVGFGYEPDHEDLAVLKEANPAELNDHSRAQHTWLHSLPPKQQPYFQHLSEIDHLWPAHGEGAPAWVSCPGHPHLETAVAEHFTGKGHTCSIGDPAESSDRRKS